LVLECGRRSSADAQFVSSGSKVFDALLWRKSAELAEAFIESDDLLVLYDNQKTFCFYHGLYYISDTLWCEEKHLFIVFVVQRFGALNLLPAVAAREHKIAWPKHRSFADHIR
jgi:hypothetical protein